MKSKLDRFFINWTNKDSRYWMNRIGVLISKSARKIKGFDLSECDIAQWVSALAKELCPLVRVRCRPEQDENIAVARLLSLLFTLWFYRLCVAKGHDPRRPVKVRKDFLNHLNDKYMPLLLDCLLDGSRDGEYFPDQEWNNPFLPGARYEPDAAELERQRYVKAKKGKKK